MKKIFTSRNLTYVDLAKSLLESDGLTCFTKNEHSAHSAAGGLGYAMAFAWPEIWVNDDDEERAKDIIEQYKVNQDAGNDE